MKPVLNSLLCIVTCFQLLACGEISTGETSTGETSTADRITTAVLAAQLSQEMPPLILDVRSPEEYAAGHIPGAINIEYSQLSEQIETLRSYEAEEIVIYCERGFRANRAIATLETAEKIARETAKGEAGKEAKFSTTVLFLKGHMRAWRRANLPIEKSSL